MFLNENDHAIQKIRRLENEISKYLLTRINAMTHIEKYEHFILQIDSIKVYRCESIIRYTKYTQTKSYFNTNSS